MGTTESIKKKKPSTSNLPLQGQLLLALCCISFSCFSLLYKTFMIKYFYFICCLLKKKHSSGRELHFLLLFRTIKCNIFSFPVCPHSSIQNAHSCIYTEVHTLFLKHCHRISDYKLKPYKFWMMWNMLSALWSG